MKKFLSCFLILLIFLSSFSLSMVGLAAGTEYIVTRESGAKLFAEKNLSSQRLAELRYGTIVTALEEANDFIRVFYEGYSGWLQKNDLKEYLAADPEISHIEVTRQPEKTDYYENDRYHKEAFDPSGLEVTAYYKDGRVKTISPEIYAPIMTIHNDNAVVTLSYKGHYTQFFVNIRRQPLQKIELSSLPEKLEYKEGSELDLSGILVTAFYADDTWQPRELEISDFEVSGYDKDSPGIQTIRVKYKYDEITAEFQVEVIPKILEHITIETLPDKLDYYGNDRDIKLAGLKATAHYDNGFSKALSSLLFKTGWVEESPEYDAKTQIWLSYTDAGVTKTVNYEVMLHKLRAIGLNVEGPEKKDYLKGGKLDTSKLLIYLEYNSGKKEYITKDFELTAPDMNIAGTHIVGVKYGGHFASFQIRVWSTNLYGDVNFDLKVSAVDARKILRTSARLETLNAEQAIVAAMGRDSAPRASDARMALRISARLEDAKYIFED